MTPQKLNLFFAFFPYGGNGGISSEHPSIRRWFTRTMLKAKADERISDIMDSDFSDTPITMTRNACVRRARDSGADVLVMCDSDQHPDYELDRGDQGRPFWDSSFDYLYDHYAKGPVVIGAPYCGPPPNENVYVFKWANRESEHPNMDMSIQQYSREEAAIMAGIQECAALPTGLIMFDMRVFDLIAPPWFYYEYTDSYESEKASTEDVTCTRDLAMTGQERLGYNPIKCNWSAWAGHWKPKCVGKPRLLTTDQVNDKYRDAVLHGKPRNLRMVEVTANGVQL